MRKQLFAQVWELVRNQPLLTCISVLGTAFAITMIMVIVIVWQTKYADLVPEVNRSRCLYISAVGVQQKDNKSYGGYSSCSPAFMKRCVEGVPGVEACTAFSPATDALVSLSDGGQRVKADISYTDPAYWHVFRFDFLSGAGFTEADWGGNRLSVVLCASVARHLFGTTDAVGQYILLNRREARVVGVVKDVSLTAKDAYAQVWTLYPKDELTAKDINDYATYMHVAILGHSKADFPRIREGITKRLADLNAGLGEWQLTIMEQPDDIVAHVNHIWSNVGPDMSMIYLQYALALVIILLVPSLNLCGLSSSRMQQRTAELGVRKAFGATRGVLIRQMLNENLVLSVVGGIVGLVLSYASVYVLRGWLFTNNQNVGSSGEFSLSMGALFSPTVFVLVFLFCVLINLLSAWLPAWMATRRNIVESLYDH